MLLKFRVVRHNFSVGEEVQHLRDLVKVEVKVRGFESEDEGALLTLQEADERLDFLINKSLNWFL